MALWHQLQGRPGFTLVELVAVLVTAGIILAVAAPRFFDIATFQGYGYSQTVLSSLRYARKYAVSSGCPVRFTVAASGYALTQRATNCTSGAYTLPVTDPVRSGAFNGPIPKGISVSPLPTSVIFAADGTASAAVTLDVAGRTIQVVSETGYIYSP